MTQSREQALSEILQRTDTSEQFSIYANQRTRNVRGGVSRIPDLRKQMEEAGFQVNNQEFLVMFRELERAKVGRLEGDLFRWSIPLKALGELAPTPAKPIGVTPTTTERSLTILFENGARVTCQFTPSLTTKNVAFLAERLLKELRN